MSGESTARGRGPEGRPAEGRRYSIGELAELTRVSRRTVHFYVQRRLIEAPLGRGRGRHYDERHVRQILGVRELQRQGVPLAEMAAGALSVDEAQTRAAQAQAAGPSGAGAVTPVVRIAVEHNVTVEIGAAAAAVTPELVADLTSAVSAIISRHRDVREAGGGAETAVGSSVADGSRTESSSPAAGRSPGPGTRLQGAPEVQEES